MLDVDPYAPEAPNHERELDARHRLETRLDRMRDAAFAAGFAPFDTYRGMISYAAKQIALSGDASVLEEVLVEASRYANAASNFEA